MLLLNFHTNRLSYMRMIVSINVAASDSQSTPNKLSTDGAKWVDSFMTEMMSVTNIDDAKALASRVLQILEKSTMACTADEALESFQKEKMLLKEQFHILIRENSILKCAVATQLERQKECEGRNQELQQLKQLLCQCQKQVRTFEVDNYALQMHLRQAQQGSSIPRRFHSDVF